jgi:hypothetical protein
MLGMDQWSWNIDMSNKRREVGAKARNGMGIMGVNFLPNQIKLNTY